MTEVVVTGLGAITPLGEDVESTWDGLRADESGASRISNFDISAYPTLPNMACEVDADLAEWDITEPHRMGRYAQFAVIAAQEAIEDADLDLESRSDESSVIGTSIANAGGGFTRAEQAAKNASNGDFVSPRAVLQYLPNMAAGYVSELFGTHGPNRTSSAACAAGGYAIANAVSDIRSGRADVMLAGGTEAPIGATPMVMFNSVRGLSTNTEDPTTACRPFDEDRDGILFGEGAGVLVLESAEHARERGATPLAKVTGFGLSADASHPTKPPENAIGMRKAIRAAMADVDRDPEDIDYVNAHATGTPTGDEHESTGLDIVFDDCPPVTSVKGSLGHPLGAAGAVEAIVSVKSIQDGLIPATNCENRDEACDVPVVTQPREADVDVVMSESFGFGGTNCAVIIESA